MFWTASQPNLNHALLNEVATSAAFSDSVLFVHAALGTIALLSLLLAYLVFGRSVETPRTGAHVPAPNATRRISLTG